MTGLASTAGLFEGEPVSGTGIPAGTTIAAINSASVITLSLNATASGSSSLTFARVDPVIYTDLTGTLHATTAVTGLSSTAGLYLGEAVSGKGIPLGTTIAQVNSSSAITLSQAATLSGSSSLSFLSDFRPLTGTLKGTTAVIGLPSTLGLSEGEAVLGAGIPAGATIAAINSTTAITLSQAATTSVPTSLNFVSNATSLAATLNGTTAVSGLPSTVGLYDGELVVGAGIPAGTTIARITSSTSITLSQAATASGSTLLLLPRTYDLDNYVYVAGQASGTLMVYSRNPSTNVLTLVQTLQDGVNGVRGIADATGVAVSQDGQFVYLTSGSGSSMAVLGAQPDGTLVVAQVLRGSLGLQQPAGLAVDPTTGDVYVASQQGLGFGGGGLASFTPALGTAPPGSLSVTYNNMQQLTVQVGNSDNQVSETHHAVVGIGSTNPAQLSIIAGDGDDSINLLDIASTVPVMGSITSTTSVSVGSGSNNITANATNPSTTLTINPNAGDGGGNNFVELDGAAAGDHIKINLGNGNSTAQVEGTALDPTASVHVNGGTGYDTLLFDAQGNAITAYDQSGTVIPSGIPATPNGQIQVAGGADARVIYTLIQFIPGFVGAIASAGGPYDIHEGQGVTLSGTATAATGTTILGEDWDLNGDGSFGDASGLNPTITWTQLAALGLNVPGTYPIAMRVYSSSSTVTVYSSLVITPVRPMLTLTATSPATAGVPYTIDFSGTEVPGAGYGITGWTINWGDGTTSPLPSTATSATHTYTTVASDTIVATASDPYYLDSVTVLSGTLSASSATVTGLPNTAFFYPGEPVSGTGIPAGTTILAIESTSSLILSKNATTGGSSSLSFTSTATSTSQSITVSPGAGSISAGGPYTISTGDSLTLTATAADNLAATAFEWDLFGQGNFVTLAGGTASFDATTGFTTYQVTQTWAQLQALGIDEGTYNDVRVEVAYAGSTPISTPTTLVVNPTPPTATFTGTNTTLGGSSSVSFSNQADQSASQQADGFTYSYDFYNNGMFEIAGSSSPTAAVPAILLAQPGSFVVHGRITAQDGTYSDYYTTIAVTDVAPTVTVEPDQSIGAGVPFSLSGVSFTDPGYATPSSSWNFTASIDWGDGTTSAGTVAVTQGSAGVLTTGIVSGTHLFAPNATYTVTVTVEDSLGEQGSGSFTVDVDTPTVVVNTGPNQTVAAGSAFTLPTTTFTDTAAPTTNTATINWGDGTPGNPDIQTVPAADILEPATPGDLGTILGGHTYGYPGDYDVTVSVADAYGGSGSNSFDVSVTDVAATIAPIADQHQSPGVPFAINTTFSDPAYSAAGFSLSYTATVNWGDGTPANPDITTAMVNTTPGSQGVPTTGTIAGTHTYSVHGTFPVTVTLTDNLDTQATTTLNALETPPTVSAGPNQTVNLGSPVVVAATFRDPGFEVGATPASYPATINWGDGPPGSPDITTGTVTITNGSPGVATVGTVAGSHYYADQGQYTVTVSVGDDGGGVGQGSFTVNSVDVGPTLAPLANMQYIQSEPIYFQETFTEPGIADVDTVQVTWGDGDVTNINDQSTYVNSSGVKVPVIVEPTQTNLVGTIALSHIYQGVGPYTATIKITDKDDKSDQVSATFTRLVETTTTVVVSSTPGNMSEYGQPVTFTATVTPGAPGVGVPAGNITFDVNGVPALTEALNDGTALFTPTTPLPVGPDTITAFYAGGGSFEPSDNTANPLVQTVAKDTTTTTLVSSGPATTVYGQPLTFTATVAIPGPGAGTPGGTVTFYREVHSLSFTGFVVLGQPVPVSTTAGVTTASLTWSTLPVVSPSQLIIAIYSGDGNDKGSTSNTVTQTVVQDSTTTTLASSTGGTSVFGQPVTFTATVTVQGPGAGTPTGSVTFYDGATPLGQPVTVSTTAGVTTAMLTWSALSVNPDHSITAVYSGDGNDLGSISNTVLTQAVGKDATTTLLSTATTTTTVYGQPVTFNAYVVAQRPGAGTPTGTVTFYDGTTPLGQPVTLVTINGVPTASLTWSALSVNSHSITAVYSGDGNDKGSTSNTLTQTVIGDSTRTTLTSTSPGTTFYGQPVTFTATVAIKNPGAGTPGGTVTFYDGATPLGQPVPVSTTNGVTTAALTWSTLSVNPDHSITAVYSGDTDDKGSMSNALNLAVGQDSTTTTLTSTSSGTIVFGQSVTFTATVAVQSPGAGTPGGTVTFYDGATPLGQPVPVSTTAGVTTAVLTWSTFAANATHSITAVYAGDTDDKGSKSNAIGLTVGADSTTTTLASSALQSGFGVALTLTATVTANPPSSGSPPGSVDFYDTTTGTDLGVVPLGAGGTAALTTTSLPPGPQTITATYTGSGFFTKSSASLTEAIVPSIIVLSSSLVSSTQPLALSGGAVINIPGAVIDDSPAEPALTVSGTSRISASSVQVVGTVSESGGATISPTPITGITPVSDPLAGLAIPMMSPTRNSGPINATMGSQTFGPGLYTEIKVSGNGTKLTLKPGVYIISGGGLSVTGSASITGNGVVIYNAGTTYPNAGGTYGGITLNTTGSVNLSAPTTGTYASLLFFQARTNPSPIAISGGSSVSVNGTIYAADAPLNIGGSVQLDDAFVVDELRMSGTAMDSTPKGPLAVLAVASSGTVAATAMGISAAQPAPQVRSSPVASGAARTAVTVLAAPPTRTVMVSLSQDTDDADSPSLLDPELLEEVSLSVLANGNGRTRPKN